MDDYIQLICPNIKNEDTDIVTAMLVQLGFEGFEESENGLNAYIGKNNWNEPALAELAAHYSFSYHTNTITPQNWNAIWESSFEPVVVDDFVAVRAHFHQPVSNVEHEIIITPKMSFGTGHHATTTMMIQQMRDLNFT